jgi:hypothetical protein
MMSFFHMPYLSFFGHLSDIGHMCGEMECEAMLLKYLRYMCGEVALFEINANLD